MLFAIGLMVFFLLNVADFLLTDAVLERGGHESNPFLAYIMGTAGPRWRLVKMGGAILAIVILYAIGPGFWSRLALAWLNAAWLYVVWHNATVLRRQIEAGK